MASLGELVAGVAHELNTPIGVGVSASTYLLAQLEDIEASLPVMGDEGLMRLLDNGKRAAASLVQNLERSAELIRSFRQLAVDRTATDWRKICLWDYLQSILTAMGPEFRNTDHRIELHCDKALEISTSPGAVAQIFGNLLTNSLIHGFARTKSGQILIDIKQEGEQLCIQYSDNGEGADPKTIENLFEPFFTTRRGRGGTGLGLHQVYILVTQALSGSIECRNITSGGLGVCIHIPIAPTDTGAEFQPLRQ